MDNHKLRVPSMVDAVFNALSGDIFSLLFAPGEKISETSLATRYGVSRNTIREAIAALMQMGILVKLPNRGVFVKTISLYDIREIFHLRLIFESEALSRVCSAGIIPPLLLDALRQMELLDLYKDWAGYVMADSQFHSAIVDAAGSERLSRMYNTISSEVRLCISQSREILETGKNDIDDHHQITHYIQVGTAEEAVACLTKHLNHAVSRFEKAFLDRENEFASVNLQEM